MDQPAGSTLSVALLMDFQINHHIAKSLNISSNQINPGSSHQNKDAMQQLKNRLNIGSKDLSNSYYENELILLFDFKFASNEQFEDLKTLQALTHSDNVYLMPREVKYEDYYNSQFDSLLKATQANKQESGGVKQKKIEIKEKRQKLIEVELLNINSVLRRVVNGAGSQFSCIAAIEPLTQS